MSKQLNLVDKTIVLFYALSPFLYLVRVLFNETTFAFIALRALQPLLICVVLFSLLFVKIRLTIFSLFAFLILFYGIVTALLNGNELFNILTGTSHFLLGFSLFTYYSNKHISEHKLLELLRITTIYTSISLSIVITLISLSTYFFGVNIYLGLATQVLIPLTCYALFKRNYLLFSFLLLLLLLSGKRAVLLSVFIAYFIFIIPVLFSSYRSALLKVSSIVVLCLPLIFTIFPDQFEKLIDRYSYDGTKTLDYYTSGRLAEAQSSLDYLRSDMTKAHLGSGFGYTYTYKGNLNNSQVENYKNVHFSYLNPILIFGIIPGIIYILFFFGLATKSLLKRVNRDSILFPMKISIIGYLIYASFSFIIFNEPLLWILMAIFNSKNYET